MKEASKRLHDSQDKVNGCGSISGRHRMKRGGGCFAGDKLRLPGSSQKKYSPAKRRRDFLVLQRGFPLSGMNFDSPGATGKKFSRRKAREFFWCSSGDKLRLPGSSQKKYSPAKRRGNFFGAPAGISPNGDKLRLPGSSQEKIFPRQKAREYFLVLQRGFEPRTPCLKGRCSAY